MATIARKLEDDIWLQFNIGKWPEILSDIKPNNWDTLDFSSKGELVIYRFEEILNKIASLTNTKIDLYQVNKKAQIMDLSTIKNPEYYIWLDLNNGKWPEILIDIKPRNWDALDFGSKDAFIRANYAKIYAEISALNREYFIWLALNNGEWPDILIDIKPSNWDTLDFGSKGELILANFGLIHSKIRAMNSRLFNHVSTTLEQKFTTKKQQVATHQI